MDKNIKFGIYNKEHIDCEAIIEKGKVTSFKLLFKSPRKFYYSFLNDAEYSFRKSFPQYF